MSETKKRLFTFFSNAKKQAIDSFSNKKIRILYIGGLSAIAIAILAGLFCSYVSRLRSAANGDIPPEPLSSIQQSELQDVLAAAFPDTILSPLPYNTSSVNLSLNARSSIVLDQSNGCILYENNADEIIPPASLTKLVVMYVVFQEVATGRISMDDIVPLPPESWAINAPPESSLMFLAEGQIVTLRELLIGLAVSSGNDAAVAIADYVSGSVDSFIDRMNLEMQKLNLQNTHFVEPSGYSENNLTTAREFAAFARVYITRYPEALTEYHSVKQITYPQEHNLPVWSTGRSTQQAITQSSTNKALDAIEGADGLKTGFIYESGYNLALTVKRGDMRIISVTMGGPGVGSKQGNLYRTADAITLSDWAYNTFSTRNADEKIHAYVPVLYGTPSIISLTEAYTKSLTVPNITDSDGNLLQVTRQIIIPSAITEPVNAGDTIGKIVYSQGDFTLEEIPLVADRTVEKANFLKCAVDFFASLFI